MEFLKTHFLSIFFLLGIIWVGKVIYTQLKYKKNGVPIEALVIDHKVESGNYFPVYQFDYEGQTLTIDGYNGTKSNADLGQKVTIYYLPGNAKGVFRESDLGIKAWEIALIVVALAYIVLDFTLRH